MLVISSTLKIGTENDAEKSEHLYSLTRLSARKDFTESS
jgi:hypothetical protein